VRWNARQDRPLSSSPLTTCWIFGTAYSGSSLLNLLLDGQPGVRGLGEAVNLVDDKSAIWCSRCKAPVRECPLKHVVQRGGFYESIFHFYDDCTVLVDSSKWWRLFDEAHGREPTLRHKAVILSKSPHEFAYSWIGHRGTGSVPDSFEAWLRTYRSTLKAIASPTDLPDLAPADATVVTYRALADEPAATIRRLCEFLSVPFSSERHARWRESDSHIIGGNAAVDAQVRDDRGFLDNPQYLHGKYVGMSGRIFRDRQWQQDAAFLSDCLEEYANRAEELDGILEQLGHGGVEVQRAEIARAAALSASGETV
jgi:hypothetical protein